MHFRYEEDPHKVSEDVFSFPNAKIDQAEDQDGEDAYKSYQRTSFTSSSTRSNQNPTPAPAPAALIDLGLTSTGSTDTVRRSASL